MIYTSSLDLTDEQRRAGASTVALHRAAAKARIVATEIVDVVREAIAKSRGALTEHAGFDAQ